MKLIINKVVLDPDKVTEGKCAGASKFLAQRVKAYCDPFVPFQTGMLKNTAYCGDNFVQYRTPYAHYQYKGVVMVGIISGSPWAKRGEAKRYTGRPLSYSGGGQRGAHWDRRMMIQRGREVTQDVAAFVGGRKKGL